ncbi:hypothetical protein [Pseudomonas sp. EA_35y_Pfl2_R5]|uniref:hypothetical protein n=1 Tax=Pseudomonas sp. EA_35y_Pfl2_R5 TaxID=3088690 RepID=UPI0030D76380
MDGNEISEINERLDALARDGRRRSKTARLRDVFDKVEAALAAGVRQADVLAELSQAGLDMPIDTFKSALQRIRRERSQCATRATRGVAQATGAGANPEGDTSRQKLAERLEPQKTKKFEHKPNSDKSKLF